MKNSMVFCVKSFQTLLILRDLTKVLHLKLKLHKLLGLFMLSWTLNVRIMYAKLDL